MYTELKLIISNKILKINMSALIIMEIDIASISLGLALSKINMQTETWAVLIADR